jgi:hypothetical protein
MYTDGAGNKGVDHDPGRHKRVKGSMVDTDVEFWPL